MGAPLRKKSERSSVTPYGRDRLDRLGSGRRSRRASAATASSTTSPSCVATRRRLRTCRSDDPARHQRALGAHAIRARDDRGRLARRPAIRNRSGRRRSRCSRSAPVSSCFRRRADNGTSRPPSIGYSTRTSTGASSPSTSLQHMWRVNWLLETGRLASPSRYEMRRSRGSRSHAKRPSPPTTSGTSRISPCTSSTPGVPPADPSSDPRTRRIDDDRHGKLSSSRSSVRFEEQ